MGLSARTRIVLWAACSLAGCGGGSTPARVGPSLDIGPHGGIAVPLGQDPGFGEVVIEPPLGNDTGLKARVAVYFLKPGLAASLEPPPTDVKVKLSLPGDEVAVLTLAAEPNAGDPAGTSRFVSIEGPYAIDQLIGELSGTLAGQPFTAPFASTR